jgi:exosortase A
MSAIPADLRIASPWRSAVPTLAALLLAIGWLYRDTALTMVGIWWRSETFAHCMLVPPISLWLIWRQRSRLAALQPRPQPWVLVVMLAVAGAWLLSELVVVNAATQFAFVTLLILAVPAVLGIEAMRAILFPLLFLYFGVPFGEFMLPTMMEWTANFTVGALQLSGVPVFREGQHFVIPTGQWSVIDECSGVRYVMASFMVGSLFAYLNYRSYARRAVFMIVALVLPVLANWLRAYIIVMLAYLTGNRLAVGVDHILYGWVFFGLIIFVMFMVGARWSQRDDDNAAPAGPLGDRARQTRRLAPVAVAAAFVAWLPHLALAGIHRLEGQAAAPSFKLPPALPGGWSGEGAAAPPVFEPQFSNPSLVASRVYAGPKGAVGVQLAYFRGQDEQRKLVSSSNMLVGMRDEAWNLPVFGRREVAIDGQLLRLSTAELLERERAGAPRARLRVWRVYWVDGRFIAGDLQAKLAGALSRLRGHGDDGALLLLYAAEDSVAASDAALEAFARASLADLGEGLERTRRSR